MRKPSLAHISPGQCGYRGFTMQYENLGPGEERATGEMSKKKKSYAQYSYCVYKPNSRM